MRLLAEPQRFAEEVGQEQAHAARGRGIRRGQRADRVQAVEDEMRIDLRAQRPELRLARQQAQLDARVSASRDAETR